jgi:hypothetical protein
MYFLNEYFGNQIKWKIFRNLLTEEIKKIGVPTEVDDVINRIRNTIPEG